MRAVALLAVALAPAATRAEPPVPLEVRSTSAQGALHARIEGVISRPLAAVAAVLAEPLHWCQFVPIDPTVRGCVWRADADGAAQITLLGGSEQALLPDTAFELPYRFQVLSRTADALEVRMLGDQGPMGSRDYRLQLRATRAGAERTRLEVSTSFAMSEVLEAITQGYLDTLARHKLGFSVVGRSAEGEPQYVRGLQGLIERGAMRHYLALEAYLDSLEVPAGERFEASLRRWWQLSQRHPQLAEDSREEYLERQLRHHRHQARAQEAHQAH